MYLTAWPPTERHVPTHTVFFILKTRQDVIFGPVKVTLIKGGRDNLTNCAKYAALVLRWMVEQLYALMLKTVSVVTRK